ncbi:glycosyltransferase [Fluviispira multicolorata]|uniref:UDP:flavonoid glycosyltransferase YjiC, YdhE family n=1 Tax=Fluviispira multicolorata TaxID=2654512 RepID=A0A833N7I3_9BACT|nr:glycosyltransferase [Fluviispira multicolorata]KAB8032200.1 hypothetical protein GCL57_06015 [Fluviispira multicolorata]
MSRILLITYGSYGDLHPYIGMGKALLAAGHEVTLISHLQYKENVEKFGLKFIAMRPSEEDFIANINWAEKAHNPNTGTQYFIKELILPYLEESFQLLEKEIPKYDLVIPHFLTFAAPLVADKYKVPWLSCLLQPSAIFSVYDPPYIGNLKYLSYFKFLGPRFLNLIHPFLFRNWHEVLSPVNELRLKLGQPKLSHKQHFGEFSQKGIIALFPKEFANKQSDWPQGIHQLGFPLFDQESSATISNETQKFLDKGEAPVVFTLGSTVVRSSNSFYENAYEAVKEIGLRAIFLVGKTPNRVPIAAYKDSGIHISDYEPFSALFSHCSVVVHQCGIGTTGQALAAAKPQILIPFSHDQPDNARRIVNLGIGLTIPADSLSKRKLTSAIRKVIRNSSFKIKAEKIAQEIEFNGFNNRFVDVINKFLKNK